MTPRILTLVFLQPLDELLLTALSHACFFGERTDFHTLDKPGRTDQTQNEPVLWSINELAHANEPVRRLINEPVHPIMNLWHGPRGTFIHPAQREYRIDAHFVSFHIRVLYKRCIRDDCIRA